MQIVAFLSILIMGEATTMGVGALSACCCALLGSVPMVAHPKKPTIMVTVISAYSILL